jgi:uncharacterized small protein (DUF1192 family)
MDTDDLEPPKRPAGRPDMDIMSIEQLEEYISDLEGEIARARTAIAGKQSARSAADSFFKS